MIVKNKILLIAILILAAVACQSKRQTSTSSFNNDIRIHLQQAAIFLNEQKCQEAVNEYKLYLSKKNDSPEAYNFLGLSYLCLRNYAESKASFQKALELDPLYSQVHHNLGILYMETNDLDKAEKEFLEVLKDKRVNPSGTLFNLALLYLKKGDLETALFTAKKSSEYQPDETAPRLLYASILERMNRDEEAIIEYRSILEKNPKSQEANYNLANLLHKIGKECEAKFYYLKVLDINPTNEIGLATAQTLKKIKCSEELPITPLPPPSK